MVVVVSNKIKYFIVLFLGYAHVRDSDPIKGLIYGDGRIRSALLIRRVIVTLLWETTRQKHPSSVDGIPTYGLVNHVRWIFAVGLFAQIIVPIGPINMLNSSVAVDSFDPTWIVVDNRLKIRANDLIVRLLD